MARKNEFKPDKPQGGLLSHLYLTRTQRRGLLRWSLYALVLLVLSLLQDVVLCRVDIGGATTDLVPCAIMLICILEGTEKGSVFSLTASALYLFSGSAPGIYSMVLITFLAILATIFRQAYLQRSFGATLICMVAAVFLYEWATYGLGVFLGLTRLDRFGGFCICAGLSLAAVPVLYPICTAIESLGGEAWRE